MKTTIHTSSQPEAGTQQRDGKKSMLSLDWSFKGIVSRDEYFIWRSQKLNQYRYFLYERWRFLKFWPPFSAENFNENFPKAFNKNFPKAFCDPEKSSEKPAITYIYIFGTSLH